MSKDEQAAKEYVVKEHNKDPHSILTLEKLEEMDELALVCFGHAKHMNAFLAGVNHGEGKILKLAQERCWDHVRHSEGRLVNHDNPEDAWGEQMSANDLLEYIKENIG